MLSIRLLSFASLLALASAACGGGDGTCDPVALTGCDGDQMCENVAGADPACFAPVWVRGQVFDLETDAAIAGARVVAVDVNGAPVSQVAVSADDGTYALRIPSTRDADGVPAGIELTLRGEADGYQTYPGGVRQALPVDTAAAVLQDDGSYLVQTALTDIGLFAASGAGSASISGTVEVPADHAGVLVVAEGPTVGSTIADRDGHYVIFNLDAGDYDVTGYARGVNYTPGGASLADGGTATVDLAISGDPAATINGTVQLVNPEGASATSIILVVKSTFDAGLGRGDTPPGLRAPEPGIAPDVSGAFTITGVPAGDYYILAAFENDGLVRDPDLCISGTDLVEQVVGVGDDITISDSFKVTGAVAIRSPGASGAEQISGTPTFVFADDPSADEYHVTVVDAFGQEVWSYIEPDQGGGDKSVPYAGPALETGMYYQLRVVSTAGVDQCQLSRTEDLKGVFYLP